MRGTMQTKLRISKSRHGYRTADRRDGSNEKIISHVAGLDLSRMRKSGILSRISAHGRVKRKAESPERRALLNASSPTTMGLTMDFTPPAAALLISPCLVSIRAEDLITHL
jgi:hypothetical protein